MVLAALKHSIALALFRGRQSRLVRDVKGGVIAIHLQSPYWKVFQGEKPLLGTTASISPSCTAAFAKSEGTECDYTHIRSHRSFCQEARSAEL